MRPAHFALIFTLCFACSAAVRADMPNNMAGALWQFEIANDSPNGWTFSDAYETHAMSISKHTGAGWFGLTAALVAPKRPKSVADNWTANRAFGELLTGEFRFLQRKVGQWDWYSGGAVTIIGSFGLDSVQEEVHSLLGYDSMRNDLENVRMDDAVLVSALVDFRRALPSNWQLDAGFEFGTRRNATGIKISKISNCSSFAWHYHAKLELIANDEVVAAAPVNADIRHIVPTLGLGACFLWRGFPIQISEEISLPRIRADDKAFPMVRLRVAF